nr:MAG TPA: hypothetical protein [Caudoviricetes sp.]
MEAGDELCRWTAGRSARQFALAFLLFALPAITSGAATMGQEPGTVTLTMEQWARLKQNSEKQSETIRKQAALWNQLSASQQQQAETLTKQAETIAAFKKKIEGMQTSLERANSLLKRQSESLENQKTLYQKLTAQMESEEKKKNHQIKVAKRQRDAWAIGAIILGAAGIAGAISHS